MLAASCLQAISVSEISDRNSLMVIKDEWNRLVAETSNQPFYRHEFIVAWINNFIPQAKLRILTGRNQIGELVAVLPLFQEYSQIYGLPVRQLTAIANSHSCRFDLIALDPALAGKVFFDYLLVDHQWDMIKLIDVPADGNAWHLYGAAKTIGHPIGQWESQRAPFISLPNSWELFQKSLDSKFRENLRRRRRRLEKQGPISVQKITGVAQLSEWLEIAFAIEQSGWKGLLGTAIAQQKETRGFYTDLAYTAAEHNYLVLFFLLSNDKPIAFQYCFNYQNCFYSP